MSRLLLTTAVAGLMLGGASPVFAGSANTTGASGDCQTELSNVRQELERQQLSQEEQREVDQELRRAEQAGSNECLTIISSVEEEYLQTGDNQNQVAMQRGTSGERIIVDQPDPQVQVEQPAPRVQVEQVPPEVNVTQGQPEVIVRIPEPEVDVQQRDAEVSVAQQDPSVSVQQAEPDIQIQQPRPSVMVEEGNPQVQVEQAEPQVDVQRLGEADIQYERAEPEVNVEYGQGQQDMQQQQEQQQATVQTDTETTDTETQVTAQTQTDTTGSVIIASDVIGMDVASAQGEDLGSVEDIVYDTSGQHYLVISSGGFLGLGEEQSLVPMDRVGYSDNSLILMSTGDMQPNYDLTGFTSVDPNFEINTNE